MIDSSTLLLTIVMTTPVQTDNLAGGDYVTIQTFDGVMQRLCWPHARTLNSQCGDSVHGAARKDKQAQNLMKAINQLRYIRYR